jgi:hypothetical protein
MPEAGSPGMSVLLCNQLNPLHKIKSRSRQKKELLGEALLGLVLRYTGE